MFSDLVPRRWLWALPAPLLFVMVAGVQLYKSEAGVLDRWKGGGFAMFSSVGGRVVRVHLLDGQRCVSENANWPERLRHRQDRLKAYPSEDRLEELSKELTDGSWRFYFDEDPEDPGRQLHLRSPWRLEAQNTYAAFPVDELDAAHINVWQLHFHADGEDRNRNGRLDPGEDRVANGYIDKPVVTIEKLATHEKRVADDE